MDDSVAWSRFIVRRCRRKHPPWSGCAAKRPSPRPHAATEKQCQAGTRFGRQGFTESSPAQRLIPG